MRHLYHTSSLKSQGISQKRRQKEPAVREYQNTTVFPGYDKTNTLVNTQQLWLPVVVV